MNGLKRCKMFRHEWSIDVYIPFGYGFIAVKVCKKCAAVKKSTFHVVSLEDVAPSKIEDARIEALGENWNKELSQ